MTVSVLYSSPGYAGQIAPNGGVNIDVSTGLDASNTLITTGGQADAHWGVNGNAAQVVAPGNLDSGFWIAIDANAHDNGPSGYAFTRMFSLAGVDLGTVDDSTPTMNDASLHGFSAPRSDFLQDTNTLRLTMTFADRAVDGVRLEGAVTTDAANAVSELATLGLLELAVASLGLLRRWRAGALTSTKRAMPARPAPPLYTEISRFRGRPAWDTAWVLGQGGRSGSRMPV